MAPAPAVEATHVVSHEHSQQCTVEQIVDLASARVIEHVAPVPLDVDDATLMEILDDLHQAMKRIDTYMPLRDRARYPTARDAEVPAAISSVHPSLWKWWSWGHLSLTYLRLPCS